MMDALALTVGYLVLGVIITAAVCSVALALLVLCVLLWRRDDEPDEVIDAWTLPPGECPIFDALVNEQAARAAAGLDEEWRRIGGAS